MIPPVDVPEIRSKYDPIGFSRCCSISARNAAGNVPRIPPPSMQSIRREDLLPCSFCAANVIWSPLHWPKQSNPSRTPAERRRSDASGPVWMAQPRGLPNHRIESQRLDGARPATSSASDRRVSRRTCRSWKGVGRPTAIRCVDIALSRLRAADEDDPTRGSRRIGTKREAWARSFDPHILCPSASPNTISRVMSEKHSVNVWF